MRRPKVNIRNERMRQWQEVHALRSAQLDESSGHFFLQFDLHWKNINLMQQFRRTANREYPAGSRRVEFTFYPVPGGKPVRKDFKMSVVTCWQKNGVCHIGAKAEEISTYEKR